MSEGCVKDKMTSLGPSKVLAGKVASRVGGAGSTAQHCLLRRATNYVYSGWGHIKIALLRFIFSEQNGISTAALLLRSIKNPFYAE